MSNPVYHEGKVHVMKEKCSTCIFRTTPAIPKTPCIEWTGATSGGYGVQRIAGKNVRVHRKTWEDSKGPIPEGLIVMHMCDNPPCYRLDHLALGTHQDNSDDKFAKGRGNSPRGEQAGRAVLTEKQAYEVLLRLDQGESLRAVARVFGVSAGCVQHIAEGRNWKHLVRPMKVSNLMTLSEGRVKEMVESSIEAGSAITCHKTIHEQAEQRAICRGFFDSYADQVPALRLAHASRIMRGVDE